MTALAIRVSTRPKDGQDVAEAEHHGQTFRAVSRNGCTMALARDLVAAGAPDQAWRAIGPDGRTRFGGPSLHRLAGLTITESDETGRFCICRWRPREIVPARCCGDTANGAERRAA